MPAARLAALLWDGEPPVSARAALHTHVSRLRALLDPGRDGGHGVRLQARDHGYVIETDRLSVDAHRFTALVEQARATPDPTSRATLLRTALSLWRGPLLADCATDPARERIAIQLDELRLTATELAIDADLGRGLHRELIGELTTLTGRHPLHEPFWGQLAVALYRGDRQADALDALARARRNLVDELGVEPGPPLRRLHRRILNADPALLGTAPGPVRPVAQRQLPMDIAEFTGRTAELARLHAQARSTRGPGTPAAVCAIVGMGGVGKTRLAVRAAHELTAAGLFPDGQLWADLRGFHPDQPRAVPSAVLERFLRTLGVPTHEIPDDLEERSALYRTRLSDRRALILLDDAIDENQIRPLLPGGPGCLVLVTSRRSLTGLDGAHTLPLDVFSTGEALALMNRDAGPGRVDTESRAARRIAELCGHLPLAIAMASRYLRNRPSWRLADLADRLADQDRRLTRLSRHDRAVRPTFDMSYRALPERQQRLFRLLAVHPGDDFATDSVAALADITDDDAESALESLLDEHLLQQAKPGRYHLHDLIRLYAAELTRELDGPDVADTAFTRVVRHYLQRSEQATLLVHPSEFRRLTPGTRRSTMDSASSAVAWAENELANLIDTVRRAANGTDELALLSVKLVQSLYRPTANRGHSSDRIELNRLAARTAHRLGERAHEAQCLEDLGALCGQIGQLDDAVAHSTQALCLWTELGDDVGQEACLADLGNTHRQLGLPDQAAEYLERGLAKARAANHRAGEASMLNYLGLLRQRTRPDLAVEDLRRSRDLHRSLGNSLGEAIAQANLGWAHQRAGQPEIAVEMHRHALAGFRGLGDRYNEAEQLWGLGQAQQALGDNDSAREHWHSAITILRDIGLLDSTQAAELTRQAIPETPEIIRLNT